MKLHGESRRSISRLTRGFALRELVAIICVGLIVVCLAAPTLRRIKTARDSVICIDNLKQLIFAWQMYAEQNEGKLIETYHGGGTVGYATDARNAPWAAGWLDWTASSDNTNLLYLRTSKYSRLAPLLGEQPNLHKCPADNYLSRVQAARGFKMRVRSYSMNITMGNGNAVTGPWDPLYRQAKTIDALLNPSPAETTVLLDEHPDSINDPCLYPPTRSGWVDLPGNLHHNAGTISFADAHVEMHPWKGPIRGTRVSRTGSFSSVNALPVDPDRSWLSYHSQRQGSEAY